MRHRGYECTIDGDRGATSAHHRRQHGGHECTIDGDTEAMRNFAGLVIGFYATENVQSGAAQMHIRKSRCGISGLRVEWGVLKRNII